LYDIENEAPLSFYGKEAVIEREEPEEIND
jgi:hypothetical protein